MFKINLREKKNNSPSTDKKRSYAKIKDFSNKHPKITKTAKVVGVSLLISRLIFGGIVTEKVANKVGDRVGKSVVKKNISKIHNVREIKIPEKIQKELLERNKNANFGDFYFYNGKKIKKINIDFLDLKSLKKILTEKNIEQINNIVENLSKRNLLEKEFFLKMSLFELDIHLSLEERQAINNIAKQLPAEITNLIDKRYNLGKYSTKATIYYLWVLLVVGLLLKSKTVKRIIKK